MSVTVVFASEKLKKAFENLRDSKTEDRMLYEWLKRAMDDIAKNPASGIQIPRRLIPRQYIQKYGIDNLWKYNLQPAECMETALFSGKERNNNTRSHYRMDEPQKIRESITILT